MTNFMLIRKNLFRHKRRASLMSVCILTAFAIFGVLGSIERAINAGQDVAAADRLVVVNKINFTQPLPIAYFDRVRAIEVAGRLVAQQKLRVGNDRAGNRDALLLTARHLARIMLCPVGEVDDVQRRRGAPAPLSGSELGEQQRQLNVLRRTQHWHQIIELEDEADVRRPPAGELAPREPVDRRAGDMDFPRVCPVDRAQEIEQGRLP